ncbi:MAG: uracil-DNA glycosylase [Muribaculaceae bacterium]|nr:uracil-DNA glycosylase [Muribaculaceae bacterium]
MNLENIRLEEGWKRALSTEFEEPYFRELTEFVRSEYASHPGAVFPPARSVFAAFDAAPFDDVKVVILGQDPYHGRGQANGLAFSVNPGVAFPPSLRNIFQEVGSDTGAPAPADGDLSRWARQGVLLLNSTLTVREGSPKSHAAHGWERFTSAAVARLAAERNGVVFLLWGADAAAKRSMIDPQRHLVLTAPHPSPLSAYRGFFGCRHFSQANEYLHASGREPIAW